MATGKEGIETMLDRLNATIQKLEKGTNLSGEVDYSLLNESMEVLNELGPEFAVQFRDLMVKCRTLDLALGQTAQECALYPEVVSTLMKIKDKVRGAVNSSFPKEERSVSPSASGSGSVSPSRKKIAVTVPIPVVGAVKLKYESAVGTEAMVEEKPKSKEGDKKGENTDEGKKR